MGSKKRGPSVMESESEEESSMEIDNISNDNDSDDVSDPSPKKKLKKDKQIVPEKNPEIDSNGKQKVVSVKPMERRKQKKALDKKRHLDEAVTKVIKPISLEAKDDEKSEEGGGNVGGGSKSSKVLPEFHIGVFKELASADVSVRDAAAEALVTELIEVQKAYDGLESKEVVEGEAKLEAEKDDGLNNCAPSVRYAVRRLIRGVSSSRECARQGFALGLAILVAAVPSIKIDSLLKLIVDLLEVTSSMKGQEARDCLLGRLFAYGALARSGRLIKEWLSDKDTPLFKEFTTAVISLAAKKRYLQEPAVSVLLELVEKLPVEALTTQVLEVPALQEWFQGATENGNPDALLLALKIQEKFGIDDNQIFGLLLPSPYSSSSLFSADHLASLANCLKESTFCQPRVHTVWPLLINILLPDSVLNEVDLTSVVSSSKKHKKSRKGSSAEEDIEKNLRNFCEVVIEGSLLTSSHDRKHLALDVILLVLRKLPVSYVDVLLSYKVVQCLMDVLSTKDSWLYKVSQHFLKEIAEWVKDDDIRKVAVIVALQKHSNGKFDCITRTKTVKDLMADFNTESGCMLLIQNLTDMFLDDGQASEEPSDQSQTTDDNSEIGSIEDKDSIGVMGTSEFLKSWVVDYLPNISKHLKLEADDKFRVQKEIMKFLSVQGLFSSSLGTEVTSFELQEKFRWPKSAISSALRRVCIEQLQSLLASAQKGEGPHVVFGGVEANDLGSYFMRFVNTLNNIPSVSLYRELIDDDKTAFKELLAKETWLSREERNCGVVADSNKMRAFRYLLIQLLLQILLRPGEFSEAASELIICCKKAFGPEISEDDEADGDGIPDIMDVLVDTMLSLLPQSSAPMRAAIEQVFKYFCNDITDDGLLRMLRVVKKGLKPARHQDSASEDEDEDEDDLLEIEEDDESDKAETGETGDSSEDVSEAVVRIPAASEELPDASDDDSDDGMDDDAMFRMDTYLARIFREKKNQAGGETAQSQLVLFKLRVLSLLEIYLHENPGNQQVVRVFSSLAQAFVNPQITEGSEQLSQRIWGILQKKIFKAKEFPRGEGIELPVLESLLEKNLKLAAKPFKRKKSALVLSKKKQSISKNRHKMITSLAQNSTYWILKIIDLRNFPEPRLQRVFEIFEGVLTAYFDSKKSQLKSEFLKEIFIRRPWVGHHLIGFLMEKWSSAKMKFRQVEALDLVVEVLRSLISTKADLSSHDAAKKKLKTLLPQLCGLVKALVTNMPDKQTRRAEVRKTCGKLFQIITNFNLTTSFLKGLEPDTQTACESKLGKVFHALKKLEPDTQTASESKLGEVFHALKKQEERD